MKHRQTARRSPGWEFVGSLFAFVLLVLFLIVIFTIGIIPTLLLLALALFAALAIKYKWFANIQLSLRKREPVPLYEPPSAETDQQERGYEQGYREETREQPADIPPPSKRAGSHFFDWHWWVTGRVSPTPAGKRSEQAKRPKQDRSSDDYEQAQAYYPDLQPPLQS